MGTPFLLGSLRKSLIFCRTCFNASLAPSYFFAKLALSIYNILFSIFNFTFSNFDLLNFCAKSLLVLTMSSKAIFPASARRLSISSFVTDCPDGLFPLVLTSLFIKYISKFFFIEKPKINWLFIFILYLFFYLSSVY